MAYFEWAEDMEIDQGPIDADHRKLVEQVNVLHTATSEGKGQTMVAQLLQDLVRDTEEHIEREERYLSSIGYEDLAGHHVGHTQFIDALRDLQRRYEAGSVTVAAQLSQLLRDWLSIHIRRNDMGVRAFLRSQRR